MKTLSDRLLRVAMTGVVHSDDPTVIADAQDKIDRARKAADYILAPMTMEFGRALIESPESDINIECEGYKCTVKAKHFMDLYWATGE